jgi:transaldolase
MLFFIDSANVKEIEELYAYGIIDGVTTNPSLFSKEGKDFYQTAKDICGLVDGPVSLEVAALDYENIIKEGDKILSIADNVVLKLPCTWDGIKACKYFSGQDRLVNMTLCFSASQALLAAKAGAAYISPFIGRLDDSGSDGLDLIEDIQTIYSNYEWLDTQILAASIRNIYHLQQAAMIGADIATIPAKLLKQLVNHPLTDQGLEIFSHDWKKSGLKI